MLEDTDEKKEEPELKLTEEQLKMQRDMLRTELAKSLEHKKKTDQYSMEAKQHAQRVNSVVCVCVCIFLPMFCLSCVCLS